MPNDIFEGITSCLMLPTRSGPPPTDRLRAWQLEAAPWKDPARRPHQPGAKARLAGLRGGCSSGVLGLVLTPSCRQAGGDRVGGVGWVGGCGGGNTGHAWVAWVLWRGVLSGAPLCKRMGKVGH